MKTKHTPEQRKRIANIFQECKSMLATEFADKSNWLRHLGKTEFICIALTRTKSRDLGAINMARRVISSRLNGCGTVTDWLIQNNHASHLVIENDREHNYNRRIQAHRHAWVDMLVKEFRE